MEIWRDIPGFVGLYQVSNTGKIKSLDATDRLGRKHKGVVRKHGRNQGGYHVLPLKHNGVQTMVLVHRIVAEVFVDNPNGYTEVNHIDGNKDNNSSDNLEWCNHSHNIKHAFALGLNPKHKEKKVLCVETGDVFNSCREAEVFCGIKPGNGRVSSVCHNRYGAKTCGGYHWRFV